MQTTDDILFSAHGPDPIPTATTEIVGTPGNAFNVYWIVSHFPIGSVVSGPFPQKDSPNILDDENYVHISWLATPGASSYDLLFTRRLQLPKQPGNFLLVANLTETEFRDQGQDLDLYDLAGIRYGAPQQEWIFFDNRDRKQPTLRFIPWPIEVPSIIFEDGTSLSTAGAAGGAAPPDRSIQFNNNGAFSGSPDFTFDINGNVLIGTPNVVNFPPPITGSRVLSLQGPAGATMEVSRSGSDAAGNVVGQFMWLDVNTTAPSNDIGVIRVLQEGTTLSNLGSRMEFYTKQDNAPGVSVPFPQMVIDNTGNVGIGTQNPGYNLEVLGQANDPIPSTIGDAIFAVRTTNGISLRCGGRLTWPYDPWVQGVGTNGNIYINPLGGAVLIGGVDYTGTQSRLIVTVPANGPQNVATFYSFEEPRVWFGSWAGIGAPQGQMTFMTSGPNFGAWVERMRIDGTGNVGIGTQNPLAPLDVLISNVWHLVVDSATASIGTVVTINSVNVPNNDFAPLSITANALIVPGLPSINPGAGSRQLWYDPADGNIVKFAA